MPFSAKSALAKLPRAPASDLKKRGWRAMMNSLHRDGKLLITNHNEPQAVIIAAADYAELMRRVEGSHARLESALEGLKQSFDQRLSSLQDIRAAARLRSIIKAPVKLRGKVKAGASF